MESIWTELLDNQLLWRASTFLKEKPHKTCLNHPHGDRGPYLCSCNDSVNKHLELLCAPMVFNCMSRERCLDSFGSLNPWTETIATSSQPTWSSEQL